MVWVTAFAIASVVIWLVLRVNGSIGPKRRAHEAAWMPARTVDASGLSAFQRLTEAELNDRLALNGFRLAERKLHKPSHAKEEMYIEATISDTPLAVWLYTDGAEIVGPNVDMRFESWDADTPQQLATRIAAAASDLSRQYRNIT